MRRRGRLGEENEKEERMERRTTTSRQDKDDGSKDRRGIREMRYQLIHRKIDKQILQQRQIDTYNDMFKDGSPSEFCLSRSRGWVFKEY